MRLALLVTAALWVGGCGAELERGLEERQANEVVAALDRAGITADKTADEAQGRWKVTVARADVGRAHGVLEARALPRRTARAITEEFASGGLMPSPLAERARLEALHAAELERTLEGLPGVVSARVHLAIPVDDPLRGDVTHPRPTAAVLLRVAGALGVGEADVRKVVAGGVEGLQAADVSVVVATLAPESAMLTPPAIVSLGPIEVAASSRGLATALLSALLGLVALLACLVAYYAIRLAAVRKELRERP